MISGRLLRLAPTRDTAWLTPGRVLNDLCDPQEETGSQSGRCDSDSSTKFVGLSCTLINTAPTRRIPMIPTHMSEGSDPMAAVPSDNS